MQRLQRQVLPPAEDLNSTTMWMWESGTHTFCFFCFPHGDVSRSSLGTVISFFFCIIVHIDFFSFRLFFSSIKKNYKYHKRSIIYKLHAFQVRAITARKNTGERKTWGWTCFTLFHVVWQLEMYSLVQHTCYDLLNRKHANTEQLKPTWRQLTWREQNIVQSNWITTQNNSSDSLLQI